MGLSWELTTNRSLIITRNMQPIKVPFRQKESFLSEVDSTNPLEDNTWKWKKKKKKKKKINIRSNQRKFLLTCLTWIYVYLINFGILQIFDLIAKLDPQENQSPSVWKREITTTWWKVSFNFGNKFLKIFLQWVTTKFWFRSSKW